MFCLCEHDCVTYARHCHDRAQPGSSHVSVFTVFTHVCKRRRKKYEKFAEDASEYNGIMSSHNHKP